MCVWWRMKNLRCCIYSMQCIIDSSTIYVMCKMQPSYLVLQNVICVLDSNGSCYTNNDTENDTNNNTCIWDYLSYYFVLQLPRVVTASLLRRISVHWHLCSLCCQNVQIESKFVISKYIYIIPSSAQHAPGRKFRKRDMAYRIHGEWEKGNWNGMKCMKWMNWHEWIETNEATWWNWHEWIETNEVTWLTWLTWNEGIETNELN